MARNQNNNVPIRQLVKQKTSGVTIDKTNFMETRRDSLYGLCFSADDINIYNLRQFCSSFSADDMYIHINTYIYIPTECRTWGNFAKVTCIRLSLDLSFIQNHFLYINNCTSAIIFSHFKPCILSQNITLNESR